MSRMGVMASRHFGPSPIFTHDDNSQMKQGRASSFSKDININVNDSGSICLGLSIHRANYAIILLNAKLCFSAFFYHLSP